jgi:hypothetical protein
MVPQIKLVKENQTTARLVKPGDRDEELLAANGQSFVTQTGIDSLPATHKRNYRNIGLLRMAICRADRRSAECSLLPPESKLRLSDWCNER